MSERGTVWYEDFLGPENHVLEAVYIGPFGEYDRPVNYRRSCLSCCWSKGVEWPAKRCYGGLVAVVFQEQAEDILVPPLLRNCLTFNDISFS